VTGRLQTTLLLPPLSLSLSLSGCSRATAIHSALDALVPYSDVSRRAPITPPYRADTQYRGRSRLVTLESRGKWDFYKGVAEGEAVQSHGRGRAVCARGHALSLSFSLFLSLSLSRARAYQLIFLERDRCPCGRPIRRGYT